MSSTPVSRTNIKRETDLQILGGWIAQGQSVLDLGCGRGIFLEHLRQTKQVYGVGVDNDPHKITGCIKRGVPVFQGDIVALLQEFHDASFDWVVCSRTLQELNEPGAIIDESLRVGRKVGIGFINHGYWSNRLSMLTTGVRVRNEVYPQQWERSRPYNPVSVSSFEAYCARNGVRFHRHAYLRGDWRTPVRFLPSWRCGYALYEISREVR